MLNSWRSWCRLCAKENGAEVDVFLKCEDVEDLSQAIQKFFLITISPYDQCPTMICTNCYKSITNLVLFAEHSSKVEAMFTKLIFNEFNMVAIDLNNFKYQNGLSDLVFSFPDIITKCDKAMDTNDLIEENIIVKTQKSVKNKNNSDEASTSNKSKKMKKIKEKQKNDEEDIVIKNEPSNEIYPKRLSKDKEELLEDLIDNESTNEEDDDDDYEDPEIKAEDFDTDDDDSVKSDSKPIKKRSKQTKNTRNNKKLTKRFKCDKCAKSYKCEYALQRYHSCGEKKTYSCSQCEKKFPTKKRLDQHETVHLPPELRFQHSCSFCNRRFLTSTNVEAHVAAIHKGEKPFICEECGKTFRTNCALKEHKYTHIEETPYACEKCPKKFKYLKRLKDHEDMHNDTVYICPSCGLKLNTKRTLQMHMVVHSDQKNYKCNYCGNEYKRAKALKNHLIIHTGLRPYTCPFCDKTFADGSNCRKHKKLAHPTELAAMEAAGGNQPATNLPKLSQLRSAPTTIRRIPSCEQNLSNENPSCLSMSSSHLLNQQLSIDNHQLVTNMLTTQVETSEQLDVLNKSFAQKTTQPETFHGQHLFEQIQASLNT